MTEWAATSPPFAVAGFAQRSSDDPTNIMMSPTHPPHSHHCFIQHQDYVMYTSSMLQLLLSLKGYVAIETTKGGYCATHFKRREYGS
jgi:hypothetical protein